VAQWVEVVRELELYGFQYKALLVWDKMDLGMGDIDASWCPSYELILYSKKGRRDLNFQRESVLRFPRLKAKERIHPTEKPVGLLEELIKISTNPGDLVVDPFAGSGSTLKAAKNLGRSAYGVEQDEVYFKLASQRLQQELFF
jgi:site-specific DNA-methyltransferase (adenine-specific)